MNQNVFRVVELTENYAADVLAAWMRILMTSIDGCFAEGGG